MKIGYKDFKTFDEFATLHSDSYAKKKMLIDWFDRNSDIKFGDLDKDGFKEKLIEFEDRLNRIPNSMPEDPVVIKMDHGFLSTREVKDWISVLDEPYFPPI